MKKLFLNGLRFLIVFILSVLIALIINRCPLDIPTGNSPKMIYAYLILPIPYIEFFLMIMGFAGSKKTLGKVSFILQLIFLSILILLVVDTVNWKMVF